MLVKLGPAFKMSVDAILMHFETMFACEIRPPRKILKFKMFVEAILMHFVTMFVCEIRLIVQAFHVSVFKRASNPTTKE